MLQPLADEALDAFLGTTAASGGGQRQADISGVPLAVVSTTSTMAPGSFLPAAP